MNSRGFTTARAFIVVTLALTAMPVQAAPPPAKAPAAPTAKKTAPPYDPPWWGTLERGKGWAIISEVPEAWIKGLESADIDPSMLDDPEAKQVLKESFLKQGDKTLPLPLRKLTHVNAAMARGKVALRVTGFVVLNAQMLQIHVATGGKKTSGHFLVPPRLRPYKAGKLRKAGKGKRPTKAQFKALRASLRNLVLKREDPEDPERTPHELADKLKRKNVRLHGMMLAGKRHFVAALRHGRWSAGAVLVDPTGTVVRWLTTRVGISSDGPDGQDGLSIAAFVDVDGDGREEILLSEWGREWDSQTMWRLDAGRKLHSYVFYESFM